MYIVDRKDLYYFIQILVFLKSLELKLVRPGRSDDTLSSNFVDYSIFSHMYKLFCLKD